MRTIRNACALAAFIAGVGALGLAALSASAAVVGFTLTVNKLGSGSGTVTSSVGAIDCGATCSDAYADGTPITLTAVAAAGSQFTGWLGPCSGTGNCIFTIGADTTVEATFASPVLTGQLYDIDGSSNCDALTDGYLVLRYLLGLSGPALITGGFGAGATRNTAPLIEAYLADIRPTLDIDGDGTVTADTDGMLMVRHLAGLRGAGLLADMSIPANAARPTAGQIEAWISGCGQNHATLATLTPVRNFGVVPAGSNADLVATVINAGNAQTGLMNTMLTGDASFSIIGNTCIGALAPGANCAITVRFLPTGAGAQAGQIVVSATPGGSAIISLAGNGVFRLAVTVTGGGSVSSVDGKILNCTSGGGTCIANYNSVTTTTLTATTANGSGAYFSGWTAPSCTGPAKTCSESMNASKAVTAAFGSYAGSGNLMFVSSSTFAPSSIGSAAAADTSCNTLASAAGINNAAGNLWMAWLSSSISNARTRLGATTRGFVRMDGAMTADDQATLFNAASPAFLNSIRYDETGATVTGTQTLITGTNADGTTAAGQTCTDWTTVVGSYVGGDSREGAVGWTATGTTQCGLPGRLACVMKQNTAAIAPPPPPAGSKKIVISNTTFTPNMVMPVSARCVTDAGAGYTALIGSIGNQMSSLLVPGTTYVRPDGVVIGTGAELVAATQLAPARSGIFQRANGNYMNANHSTLAGVTWIGPSSPSTVGTVANTCNNWTDPAGGSGATIGNPTQTTDWMFSNGSAASCSFSLLVYCIEQ